jgi:GNAT superfamily N-acetyltransferase
MLLSRTGEQGAIHLDTDERYSSTSFDVPAIRPLIGNDHDELCRVFLCLDAAGRHSRFGHAASDNFLARHCQHAMTHAVCIAGAFIDGRIRGVAEVYGAFPNDYVEAAFVVEKDWRRQGLGWALLCATAQIAADSKAAKLRLIFSRHDWAMRRLAAKSGGRLDFILGEMCVDLPVVERAEADGESHRPTITPRWQSPSRSSTRRPGGSR